MKLRTHISPVASLVLALASLLLGSAAIAQQPFLGAPPLMPPGRQSLVNDRFYIQAGAQFRNIQRFGFKKYAHPISFVQQVGVPPFGPTQDMVATTNGRFGNGTGIPGYPGLVANPTGNPAADPRISGIWDYNNGFINPLGDALWPNAGFSNDPQLGLGQYRTSTSGIDPGIFQLADAYTQMGTGTQAANNVVFPIQTGTTPLESAITSVRLRRIMDDTVAISPENGTPSIMWQIMAAEIADRETNEQIWGPTFELGFQWTNLFDLFYGLSWFDLDRSVATEFHSVANLWREGFSDTFPFWGDNGDGLMVGTFLSNLRPNGSNVNRQILPNSPGQIGSPYRTFFTQVDPEGTAVRPPVPVTEAVSAHTSVRVYENRAGARSWTPLYGLGRFGVTAGPVMNAIYYNTSAISTTTFFIPNLPPGVVGPVATQKTEWLVSFGVFASVDIELTFNRYFLKTNMQYSVSEEKQLVNAPDLQTNLNLSGFSSIIAGGLHF
jgi:hypothetical protein